MHMHFSVCIVLIVPIQVVSLINKGQYPDSLETLTEVEDCPRTAHEWQKAANKKNCDIVQHNTDKAFAYHCVIDTSRNATVEVCVPSLQMLGYCADYSDADAKIINNLECTDFNPPCPRIYNSTDAYKYDACYDKVLHRKDALGSTENSTRSESDENVHSSGSTIIIIVAVIPLILIILIIVSVTFIWRRRRAMVKERVDGSKKRHPIETENVNVKEMTKLFENENFDKGHHDNSNRTTKPKGYKQNTS